MYFCNMGCMTIFAVAAAHGSQRWACTPIPGFLHKHPMSTINSLHIRNCIPTTSTLPVESKSDLHITSHNFPVSHTAPVTKMSRHSLSLQSFRSWLCQCQKLGRIKLSHADKQPLHSASPP